MPDSRNNRGKRHPLSAILGLAVIAMMSGCRSYAAIAEWGRTYHADLPKALGFKHRKTPCASTLHYVFKNLDATALENRLTQWTTALLEDMTPQIGHEYFSSCLNRGFSRIRRISYWTHVVR